MLKIHKTLDHLLQRPNSASHAPTKNRFQTPDAFRFFQNYARFRVSGDPGFSSSADQNFSKRAGNKTVLTSSTTSRQWTAGRGTYEL